MAVHGRCWFPKVVGRSAFNRRARNLWVVVVQLGQALGERLSQVTDCYECVDGLPLVAMSGGQYVRERQHWLFESRPGHGTTSGRFYIGDRLVATILPSGVVSGYLIANADIHERWVLEALLSTRAGQPNLRGPVPSTHAARADRPKPPVGHIGCFQAAGANHHRPCLADQGFNSTRWRTHWQADYHIAVMTVPPYNDPARAAWSRADCRWLAACRQIVETVFARLAVVFGIQHLNVHSRWGQYTRLAAKVAAYHLGCCLNHRLGRPRGALATLLC